MNSLVRPFAFKQPTPTWETCHAAGMSRGQAARARGLSYEAARKWEQRSGLRFAKGEDGRNLRHAARDTEWARSLRWASRYGLCKSDLAKVLGVSETHVARRCKAHGVVLPRAYGSWHTSDGPRRILPALKRAFSDPDVPKEAHALLRGLIDSKNSG